MNLVAGFADGYSHGPLIGSLWLVHPERAMCDSFEKRFSELPRVRVIQARFEDLDPHDCFVTAGNAFGIMTDGIDAAVVRRFGTPFMTRVQQRIRDEYLGEQPVGTAFVIATQDPQLPFIVHSPTMRVPGSISGTDKVYTATWAALLAVHSHNRSSEQKIRTVALPAMGTGFGGMPFSESARQMAAAYRHSLQPPDRLDWDTVVDRHKTICYDVDRQVAR